jgi:hypothetical protein
MNWELDGFNLDPANGLARFTFRSQTGTSAETPEHVSISVRVRDQESQTVATLRNLANQRLIQVLNEIEMALVG